MLARIHRSSIIFFAICLQFSQSLPADEIVRNEALREIQKYMNESVDPCDDFYAFACGNWAQYHPVTEEKRKQNLFTIMEKAFDEKLQELLAIDDPVDTDMETKVKYQYRACLKLPERWNEYLEKLQKIVGEFGQMPALVGDKWDAENFNWQQTLTSIQHKYGIANIVASAPLPDHFNTSVQAMYIDSMPFALGAKSVYTDAQHEPTRNRYKTKMATRLQNYLGMSKEAAEQTAEDIFEFELALVQGLPDENHNKEIVDMYPRVTLEEMQSSYMPTFDAKKFIATIWGSLPPFEYYENRMYLQNLVKVIPNTKPATVANYMFYKLVDGFIFSKPDNETQQGEKCISNVKELFSNVLENIFYRKYSTVQTKEVFDEMWRTLKLAFEDVLNAPSLDWLGAETRLRAVDKLNAIKIEIPASKEDEYFHQFMDRVTIDKDDYLENIKQILIESFKEDMVNVYKPPQLPYMGSMLSFTPVNVLLQNKILVPVAILQPYFMFSPALPNAYNYGRLAATLAHEIVHGFDDGGRLHDKHGNLEEWFGSDSVHAFEERVKCFVNQYQQYKFGGQQLPKRNKQSENIADNSGTHVAYLAYLKWYEDSGRTPQEREFETFPELAYSHRQLFFISYAQLWCADTYHEDKLEILAADSHTPAELRPAAALSNMEEFSKEFKCPLGSPMNPVKKCQIY